MSEGTVFLYVFLGIGYLIISICLIIKFFQMAKDINILKENYLDNDSIDFLIANGYMVEAKRKIFRDVWKDYDMVTILKYCKDEETFDTNYKILKDRYNDLFIRIGEEFPTYDSLRKK